MSKLIRTPFRPARLLALLAAAGGFAATAAQAADYGVVVSSTPVTAQVAVPQQQCYDEQALVQQPNSGGGALLGALIGGAIGNNFGGGFGRAAATGLGVVAGASIGDRVEANSNPPAATTVRRCQTVSRVESRLVGYDVVYDYNGQRYSTRLAQNPGERIALDASVAPSGGVIAAPLMAQQAVPVYAPAPQPAVVYAPAPYYAGPYYGGGYYGGPRVVIGVGGGGYWGGHGHWR